MPSVLNVAGARPNFMKIAPLMREMARHPEIEARLLHTGQHYDVAMSAVFFDELGIPRPDLDLGVGSGTHAQQTAGVMRAFEPVLLEDPPDLVVVVGDVNSTMACTLVAVKLGIPVAHVEAGLRSFDRTMPEEINRIVTDAVCDLCFTTSLDANENLAREGVPADRVFFVGNPMIDTLLAHRERARTRPTRRELGLEAGGFALMTLHRPSNVDDDGAFEGIARALVHIAASLPLVFPVHPRARPVVERSAALADLTAQGRLRLLEPLGYLDFLALMGDAAIVLTDSGGVQEETTILGVPCLTLRTTTERPVTVTHGTNQVVGTDPDAIIGAFEDIRAGRRRAAPARPPLWDGRAAERIVEVIGKWLADRPPRTDRRGPGPTGAHRPLTLKRR